MDLEDVISHRLAKVERWRARGIDPYPHRFHRTHTAQEAIAALQEAEAHGSSPPSVVVAGRITAMRHMGRATFIDLRDSSGRIQTYHRQDILGPQAYDALQDLDLGDFLGVAGEMFRTRTGEPTVQARSYTLLCKALRAPPEKWHGLQDIETRYRQRYLDLMANEWVREIFRVRSRIVAAVRRFLDQKGFLEVETPVLQPQAGGAAARPFVTYHNALDRHLYLRIALELHLKRLLVGGYERVYELGRVFRNEGASAKYNPEFTMLEAYQAYADYREIMVLTEELVVYTAREALGTLQVPYGDVVLDFSPPWQRLTLREAILRHTGIDIDAHPDATSLKAAAAACGLPIQPHWDRAKTIDEILSNLVEPHLLQPTFVVDYPIELSPLAKRKPEDPRLAERFELFIAGREVANAYSELNDPVEQRQRFLEQARRRAAADEEVEVADEDFLVALEHGMPPAGGLGIGIDRLVMALTGQGSIREVILFPALREKGP
ncbi:MAG: lysine--tRNA ligase [Dehalococcoidia bacterium]|nr:lysine--tRNA ligase [Dehalococcoidia bacterium]